MKKSIKRLLFFTLLAVSPAALEARINDVKVRHLVAPVMNQRAFNPVIGLNLKASHNDQLTDVVISLKGTDLSNISEVSVFAAGLDKNGAVNLNAIRAGKDHEKTKPFGSVSSFSKGKTRYRISCSDANLNKGSNHFWISVKTNGKASIKKHIHLTVIGVVSKASKKKIDDASCKQRIGVAITYPNFSAEIREPITGKIIETRSSKYSRIPGLVVTKKGTIIATFDNRYHHNGDLPADIDVAVRRSTDGGNTWSKITTCINARDIPGIGHGVGDPAILLDESNNRIWIAGLAAPKTGHPIWKSKTGTASPAECGQFILAYSDDEGKTWSKPINITEPIKRLGDPDTKNWGLIFQGPGNGICMRDGTLVFPAQVWGIKEPGGKMGNKRVGVLVYSKDNGKTWTSSKSMDFGGSESTVAELSDGSLMLNTREGIGSLRSVGTTTDLGETWTKHPSVKTEKGKLRNPFCQALLISIFNEKGRYNFGKKAAHALIFSNPNASRRSHMTLKVSTDDGNTWSKGLLYDERWGMGYSAIYPIDKNYLGVFYESQHKYLHFIAVPYSEIFQEPLETPTILRNREGEVSIRSNGPVHYTLNGSPPDGNNATLYSKPFKLPKGGIVKAVTLSKKNASRVSTARFDIAKAKWTIESVTSQNTGTKENAEMAIDDNPDTIWHSKWQGGSDAFPHSITINFGEKLNLQGFTYLPRVDNAQGGVVDQYRVEVSPDGKRWATAAKGEFEDIKSDIAEQRVHFSKAYSGMKYLRFSSLHSIQDQAHTSAAELGVITR